jgi:aspartate kinase
MLVFKFGGASVKDASSVKNVASIISLFSEKKKIIIVSAMGKTTNNLEEVVRTLFEKNIESYRYFVNVFYEYHAQIIGDLFVGQHASLSLYLESLIDFLHDKYANSVSDNYDFEYDQIVSLGELLSTKIIQEYLFHSGFNAYWLDARKYIRTDNTYRNATIDWTKTNDLIQSNLTPILHESNCILTQGFIGSTSEGFSTTLGREGSDYSAGIFAYCLSAESVTIWKDVPGMLNADPKWFDETIKLNQISFQEAIELAYYGATVIHPKTIKPLQNKNIPLYVKSFLDPSADGTKISTSTDFDSLVPSFIFKMNQIKIGVTPKDFSFIAEENLSTIFNLVSNAGIQMNMMQNSAISFDFVIDFKQSVNQLVNSLKNDYQVSYEENLELVTIRHYDTATIERVTKDKHILLTQKSEQTARILMKNKL